MAKSFKVFYFPFASYFKQNILFLSNFLSTLILLQKNSRRSTLLRFCNHFLFSHINYLHRTWERQAEGHPGVGVEGSQVQP